VPLVVVRFQSPSVKPCVRFSRTRLRVCASRGELEQGRHEP
jgi:hypothetical protein